MSFKLSNDFNREEEAQFLLEENEKLRDEIRKMAMTSEVDISCSNTTCVIESSINSFTKLLNSGLIPTYPVLVQ